LPGFEIAWRDFETAPIVASLPARPCIPRFGHLARLRRKPASVNPLTSVTLHQTPRTNTGATHTPLKRFSRLLEQEQLPINTRDKCCSTLP
jgi:hypothetical protein